MERNRKAGQNPPRVVAPIEEEEVYKTFDIDYFLAGGCVQNQYRLLNTFICKPNNKNPTNSAF